MQDVGVFRRFRQWRERNRELDDAQGSIVEHRDIAAADDAHAFHAAVTAQSTLIGFVLGIYLAEWWRLDHRQAWPSTVHAFKAVGVSILIEFCAAIMATSIWVIGVVLT